MESSSSQFLSPIFLLYLINSFFLIFVTSSLWNFLFSFHFAKTFVNSPRKIFALKKISFFVIIFLAAVVELIFGSMANLNFFPLAASLFIKFNLLMLIVILCFFIYLKNIDRKYSPTEKGNKTFIATYAGVLYLFYLIIVMATVVTRLNINYDNTLDFNHLGTLLTTYAIFIVYLLLVLVIIQLQLYWRLLIFFIYSILMLLLQH